MKHLSKHWGIYCIWIDEEGVENHDIHYCGLIRVPFLYLRDRFSGKYDSVQVVKIAKKFW